MANAGTATEVEMKEKRDRAEDAPMPDMGGGMGGMM